MSEAEVKGTGDPPPGILPMPGTTHHQASTMTGASAIDEQGMTGTYTSLTLTEVFALSLSDVTNDDHLPTATLQSTALSPESSATEDRPTKDTPMTVEAESTVSQGENQATEFLNSMAAVLDPSQGEGSEQSPVRPRVRLPPVDGSTVGSSFASSVSSVGFGNQPLSSAASFRSSVGGFGNPSISSRILGSKASPARMSSAESSRIAATLPQSFKTQMVLGCEPCKAGSSHQRDGLGVSVPASAPPAGFVPSRIPASSPLRGSLEPSKQGQELNLQPKISSVLKQGNQFNSGQTTLGSIALQALCPSDVLFYFGVLCIAGHLSPQFVFKYGGMNGKQIGAQLIMYGHTILVPATSESAYMARVAACRRALYKMRKYHPDWQIPPLPLKGSTEVQWNWVNLLEAFCSEANWPGPIYNVSILGNQWHCELVVGGVYFRTFRGFGNVDEARNSVAHHALHQLLVTDQMEVGDILPASSHLLILPKSKKPVAPPTEEAIRTRTRQLLDAVESLRPYPAEPQSAASLQTAVESLKNRLQKEETHSAGKVSGLSGGKIGKQSAKPANQTKQPRPPALKKPAKAAEKPLSPPPPRPAKGRGSRERESRASRRGSCRPPLPPNPPVKAGTKGKIKVNKESQRPETSQRPNANLEPLKNSRLAPVELKDIPSMDPLASLKAIQDGLMVLSPHASFLRVMKTMCFILQIVEPDIRHEHIPDDESGQIHSLHAHFNDPNPFLTRASPVFLANVRWISEDDALGLAVKKIILFLLKMCKDEVEVDVLEAAWKNELAWLHSLEREAEHRLSEAKNLL
ncbi:hypothetical protein F1880_001960 [Penicillium rolfsii]|nr:hypothetical protein F1880_001960 [Penicillium rolfsii]